MPAQTRSDDLLKISQTSLEEILHQEGLATLPALSRQNSTGPAAPVAALASAPDAGRPSTKRKRSMSLTGGLSLENLPAEARKLLVEQLQLATNGTATVTEADLEDILHGDADNEEMSQSVDGSEGEGSEEQSGDDEEDEDEGESSGESQSPAKKSRTTDNTTSESIPPAVLGSPSAAGADSNLKPYPAEGQLEFLDDCFQMIALMIKGNVARMKDDMKKEGATSRYNSYEGSGELKHSRRELTAKLRLQENRIQIRLKKTEEAGHPLPRLEVMNQRFNLDPFEKKIILLLIGKSVEQNLLL